MRPHRRRPATPRPRVDAATLEARRLLTTLVAIVDTGVDLASATDAPYYDLNDAYDAYRQRPASQYGNSVVQDNGNAPSGTTGHWHGSTVADEVVQAIVDTKAQAGAAAADVKILPIRATNDQGYYDTGAVIRGIHYAADEGAAVIDLSFRASGDFSSSATGETLSQAIAYAASKGAVVSVAAANDHVNVDDPANPATVYPLAIRASNMLVSAAVDSTGALSSVSNWGPQRVDLGAPAVQGATSYAAGYTSGVTGVIAALTPGMSAGDRVNLIKATVTPTTQAVGAWSTTGGVINPAGAVARAVAPATPAPVAPIAPVAAPIAPTSAAAALLIAAGSATGSGGYVGDGAYVSGGNTYQVSTSVDTSGVADPAPAAVYQAERWTAGTMTYTIPKLTPGGTYTVRLDFAENYYTGAGQRLMNIAINGTPTLSGFDIFAAAGGRSRAVGRSLTVVADASGQVAISFTNVRGGAKVDAVRITPAAAPAATTVSLASTFNAVGISADSSPAAGNLDGAGYSYSGTALGSTISTGGVTYTLGTAGSTNAVRAQGQTVALTAGKYASLRFLGAGVNGTQAGTFTISYADGTSSTVGQTFSDWYVPTGAANETTAATTASRNGVRGRDPNFSNFSVYAYSIALDPTRTVRSVTLPTNGNITLLAADLVA